jgi:hypothetical protein
VGRVKRELRVGICSPRGKTLRVVRAGGLTRAKPRVLTKFRSVALHRSYFRPLLQLTDICIGRRSPFLTRYTTRTMFPSFCPDTV